MDFCFSLTTKLPFDDDEFDHVHIQSIAAGVPENKVCAVVFSLIITLDRFWILVGGSLSSAVSRLLIFSPDITNGFSGS
jgi:heme/copper-type cytochrome/quinol oxidase subunit 4